MQHYSAVENLTLHGWLIECAFVLVGLRNCVENPVKNLFWAVTLDGRDMFILTRGGVLA